MHQPVRLYREVMAGGAHGKVYSRSTNTFIWLGPSTGQVDSAIDILDEVGRNAKQLLGDRTGQQWRYLCQYVSVPMYWTEPSPRSGYEKDCESIMQFAKDTRARLLQQNRLQIWLDGMKDFSTLPWFSRTWIIQEFALSPQSTFVCGDRRVDGFASYIAWNIFWGMYAASNFELHTGRPSPYSSLKLPNIVDHIFAVFTLKGTRIEFGSRPLADVLRQVHLENLGKAFYVTDPRDKIYALLGLASDGQRIDVDYRKTEADLYTETTKYLIQTSGPKFLGMDIYREPGSSPLPSWAIDFSDERTKRILYLNDQFKWGEYVISNNLRFFPLDTTNPTGSTPVLAIGGGRICTLKTLSVDSETCFDRDRFSPELKAEYNDIRRSVQAKNPKLDVNDAQIDRFISQFSWLRPWIEIAFAIANENGSESEQASVEKTIDLLFHGGVSEVITKPDVHRFKQKMQAHEQLRDALLWLELAQSSGKDAVETAVALARNVRLFTADEGFLGCVRPEAIQGDKVVCLSGLNQALVLRAIDAKYHIIIGQAWVHNTSGDVNEAAQAHPELFQIV